MVSPKGARFRYIKKFGWPPEIIIAKCGVCNKEFQDYASNRKGRNLFCSAVCRSLWVGVSNSITRGGDGLRRTKKEKDRIDYRKHSDKRRETATARYWEKRDEILAKLKEKGQRLKQKVVQAYGGKCECCGIEQIEFLTVDHIKGGGNHHRRQVGKGKKIYAHLEKAGFPPGYRILCFNCNITRGFYGYCPHNPHDKQDVSRVPFNPGRKRTVR